MTMTRTTIQTLAPEDVHSVLPYIYINSSADCHDRVIITDCTTVVQSIKKSPDMKTFINFENVFVRIIIRMLKDFDEAHIIFDRCDISQSLKKKRAK